MKIKPIHTNDDYENALSRIDVLMSAESGTDEFDELDILSTLVEVYENNHYKIDDPDPIEAINFRLEQLGLKRSDLGRILHCKRGRVSELMNKKRPLTLNMIRTLSKDLNIPDHVLIKEYPLNLS